ncbi:MAG TPA: glycosyltransferase family 4 protein [Acidimicrobiales bacterium]|nr:glycosyltransferase family 4 protein [Acidimicrobiales bacterium]
MKYGFVVPRYGLEVLGGAELGARMLAERLAKREDWSVEIFTTCALDHMTWANDYPAGSQTINNVVVHRFPTTSGRPPKFFPYSEQLLSSPGAATISESELFLHLQGPESPELLQALVDSDRDLLAFYPYLYTTTVRGLPKVAQRALMHPAAHDEPALHLPIYKEIFEMSQGLVFQTFGERSLVQRMFPVADTPQIVVGLGFEEPGSGQAPDEAHSGRARSIPDPDRPYLLCLGRVDGFKGSTMLAGFFAAYKERRPGPLQLVMAGPVTAEPPPNKDVIVTGPVDESEKWRLLRGATAFVNPSPHEAFSIVLLEAWSEDLPVIVNARCEATREHCERSGGGLWFDSYPEFEATMDRLFADEALRRCLGQRGRAYVQENYRWPGIIDRYSSFAERLRERVGGLSHGALT